MPRARVERMSQPRSVTITVSEAPTVKRPKARSRAGERTEDAAFAPVGRERQTHRPVDALAKGGGIACPVDHRVRCLMWRGARCARPDLAKGCIQRLAGTVVHPAADLGR
jgi:hypothetical protein